MGDTQAGAQRPSAPLHQQQQPDSINVGPMHQQCCAGFCFVKFTDAASSCFGWPSSLLPYTGNQMGCAPQPSHFKSCVYKRTEHRYKGAQPTQIRRAAQLQNQVLKPRQKPAKLYMKEKPPKRIAGSALFPALPSPTIHPANHPQGPEQCLAQTHNTSGLANRLTRRPLATLPRPPPQHPPPARCSTPAGCSFPAPSAQWRRR